MWTFIRFMTWCLINALTAMKHEQVVLAGRQLALIVLHWVLYVQASFNVLGLFGGRQEGNTIQYYQYNILWTLNRYQRVMNCMCGQNSWVLSVWVVTAASDGQSCVFKVADDVAQWQTNRTCRHQTTGGMDEAMARDEAAYHQKSQRSPSSRRAASLNLL